VRARLRRCRLLVALWVIVVAVAAGIAVASVSAENRQPQCTHGVSSVGPVTIVNGRVVGGSTIPHTQACLP
jgi:hypothetical protein